MLNPSHIRPRIEALSARVLLSVTPADPEAEPMDVLDQTVDETQIGEREDVVEWAPADEEDVEWIEDGGFVDDGGFIDDQVFFDDGGLVEPVDVGMEDPGDILVDTVPVEWDDSDVIFYALDAAEGGDVLCLRSGAAPTEASAADGPILAPFVSPPALQIAKIGGTSGVFGDETDPLGRTPESAI